MRDTRYKDDLDYLDDQAEVYARKKKEKTDGQKRQVAIDDYKRMQSAIDNCFYCFQQPEDYSGTAAVVTVPPKLPVIALGVRAYLGLPYHEPMCDVHCLFVPIDHTPGSCLNCDEDSMTEIRVGKGL